MQAQYAVAGCDGAPQGGWGENAAWIGDEECAAMLCILKLSRDFWGRRCGDWSISERLIWRDLPLAATQTYGHQRVP